MPFLHRAAPKLIRPHLGRPRQRRRTRRTR